MCPHAGAHGCRLIGKGKRVEQGKPRRFVRLLGDGRQGSPKNNGYNGGSIFVGGIRRLRLFRIQIYYSTALGEVKSKIRRDEHSTYVC